MESITESRIATINLVLDQGGDGKVWEEEFIYNDLDQLVIVNNFHGFSDIQFTYNSAGQLLERIVFEDDRVGLVKRDSFVFNEFDQIDFFYTFFRNEEDEVPLASTTTFIYDAVGQIIEKNLQGIPPNNWKQTTKYIWKDHNIIREDRIIGEHARMRHFEHDNKANYKRNNPLYIIDPINSNLNNVTFANYTGSSSLDISFVCNPCTNDYNYSNNKLPKKIFTNWGLSMELKYE